MIHNISIATDDDIIQFGNDVIIYTVYLSRAITIGEIVLRTSDGGYGNHSVSLPIILIKIKVDQMLPSSYISSLLVSIL